MTLPSLSSQRVLVTGGAGFIGSHVVDLLLSLGHRVRVLDNLDPQVHGMARAWPSYLKRHEEGEAPIELRVGDVRDSTHLLSALEWEDGSTDVVIHLAARVGVGQGEYQIAPYVETNTGGTANLLQCVLRRAESRGELFPRIFIAGSMSSYGEGLYTDPAMPDLKIRPEPRSDEQLEAQEWEIQGDGTPLKPAPIAESASLNPQGFYAATKAQQEALGLLFARTYDAPVTVGRLFNTYGPRQALGNPYTGVGAIFANRIKAGESCIIYEDGQQVRDFIYVTDVARAIVMLALGQTPEGRPVEADGVYNVCTGSATSIAQVEATLRGLLNSEGPEPTYPGTARSGDIRHCYGSPKRLEELGWQPTVPLEVGLDLLCEWAAKEEAVAGLQDAAHGELAQFGLVAEGEK